VHFFFIPVDSLIEGAAAIAAAAAAVAAVTLKWASNYSNNKIE